MDTIPQPRALEREAGEALWFFGSRTWIKATGEQTRGAYGLIEHVNLPGSASPWHLHHAEDESFYVVEGQMTFLVGNKRIQAGPGS